MKFTALVAGAGGDAAALQEEYAAAREIGNLRLGFANLFFKSGLKQYYIPYHDIKRYFRRVMQVPARLCCGRGNFDVESLVICDDERELAQIQMPGTRAAKIAMECLATLAPDAIVGKFPAAETAQAQA